MRTVFRVREGEDGDADRIGLVFRPLENRGMPEFLHCDVPIVSRLRLTVREPVGGDPVLTGTHFVPPGVPAVVRSLIVPPAG